MDKEEKLEYIKREFENEEYEHLTNFLTVNESIIDQLKKENLSLYCEIFSTIFSRNKVAFQNISELLPYIDLKKIIIYMEEQIKVSTGDERKRLVSLHDFYSITLYSIALLRDFSPIEVMALDPLAYHARVLPHDKKIDLIKIVKNNSMYNNKIDEKFIIQSVIFSKKHANGYSDIAKYLLSDERPSDFLEVFDEVHGMIMSTINTKEKKKVILESLEPVLILYENSGEYEKMSKIIDIIESDYHDIPLFSKYFSHSKFKNREYDEVKSFISTKYKREEIIANPELANYYGYSLVQLGKISEGLEVLRSAYEKSGYDSDLLIALICAQYHKDKEKVKDVLKRHFQEGYPDLTPEQVFLLLQDFVEKEPEIADILFEYFEKKCDELNIDSRSTLYYHYLLFKVQYFKSKEEYEKYIEFSEKLIDRFPQLPGGYCKLGDLYSDKELRYFDLQKALKYSTEQAEVEGTPVEYFEGITYTSANKPEKAIEKLEKFVKNNEVGFGYVNAYQNLSRNYFKIGDEEKGCLWGEEWYEKYDTPRKNFRYIGSILEAKKTKQKDYEFMLLLSEKCWKLKDKIQPEIKRINLETDRLDFAENFESVKKEKERLKQEIERLEDDIRLIKQEYVNIEDLDEDDLQDMFSQIREKFADISNITKNLNEDEYLEVKRNIDSTYRDLELVPKKVKKILRDTEFMLKVRPPESDFSGAIVNLGKVVEIILDEEISKPFMEKIDRKYVTPGNEDKIYVNEEAIYKLFPHKNDDHKTISLGGWCYFIEEYIENSKEPEDKVTRKFLEDLKSVENIRNLKSQIVEIKELRNGAAHNSIINKNDIKKDIKDCRSIINNMIEKFYSET